jgi:ABC-type antimicrobial peptide transport system permease subunit
LLHGRSPLESDGHTTKKLIIQTTNQYSNANVDGVGIDFLEINNDTLTHSQPFRSKEITGPRAVAIIGPTTASDLFGSRNPIGKEIRIGVRKYTVIGLLKSKSRDFLASIGSIGGEDANNRILLPYPSVQKINGNKDIGFFQAEAVTQGDAEKAAQQLIAQLKHRNGKNFNYKPETMASYLDTTDRIRGGVGIVGIVAASISLLVGGMGIMNIMSTSVLERTREIGLRKALGARRHDILWQFLLEAAIISCIGGIIGLALGGGVSIILAQITHFPLTPSPLAIIVALLVSVVVGILSGYLPARRAASLHPVEALRYE